MKQFNRFVFRGCLYTVLILTAFYFIALIANFPDKNISIGKYFLILGFGMLISASKMLFELKINVVIKYLTNYSVLLAAFCVVFVSSTSSGVNIASKIFISIVIFSVIYSACLLITRVIFRQKSCDGKLSGKYISKFSDKRGK